MSAANTDKILKVGKPGTATTLSSPGHTSGGTSITVGSTTNWPTDTGVAFAIDRAELVAGEEAQIPGTYTEWIGVVSGATTITDMVISGDSPNSDQNYASGSLTRVYIPVSATRENKLVEWGLTHADQDGTLKAGAVDNVAVIADDIITPAKFTDELKGGWAVGEIAAPTSTVANGNRSYTNTYASSIASTISPGMRRRFTRTVAGPTTAFSLDGTNDYYVKTSPSGMTFTDDFAVSAWVYVTSYPTPNAAAIVSRYNGTSGWALRLETTGQIMLIGLNAGATNYSYVQSYLSIPLNKWVHVSAQLDMSTFTATTTTSYVMIDGVNVPASVTRNGTNPTTLVQAGDLNIGTANGGTGYGYFPGYIDQVAIYSAKVPQATILASMHQALTGSETSLISAYSNGSVTDLSANANNLTAQNGATTVASSWHGNRGVSSTLEYALTMSVSSDGLTEVVQCPEGCALPTTGGITASAYSSMANPYGWVDNKLRWGIDMYITTNTYQAAVTSTTVYNPGGITVNFPVGAFIYKAKVQASLTGSTDAAKNIRHGLSTANNALATGYENITLLSAYAITDVIQGCLTCPEIPFNHSVATSYYYIFRGEGVGTLTSLGFNITTPSIISIIPSGL